ncbi:ankyrin repeat domain-containing protein, partial [Infirmifilum sp.]|uniref:ankyrin repeat domain-containing protein n=1 Tax=Infirmifilum sp. TaxID=2856575 RepID=UPI003D09E97B
MSLEKELLEAVSSGDVARVKELLKKGVNPNARNILGRTPLHLAAFSGNIEATRLLLEHGPNVDAKDVYGSTPLHDAAIRGNLEV